MLRGQLKLIVLCARELAEKMYTITNCSQYDFDQIEKLSLSHGQFIITKTKTKCVTWDSNPIQSNQWHYFISNLSHVFTSSRYENQRTDEIQIDWICYVHMCEMWKWLNQFDAASTFIFVLINGGVFFLLPDFKVIYVNHERNQKLIRFKFRRRKQNRFWRVV